MSWLMEATVKTAEEKQAEEKQATLTALTAAVQAHLDAKARAVGYDSIASAVTYADEPAVAKFQAEGQRFRAWRSAVWAACYAILADVEAGVVPAPTVDGLVGMLPVVSRK